jgi:murein DD-endopeptidase MepM/ murein hydrolase activator NlpD
MAKRLNTVIIVPHSRANFVKFTFSTRTFVAVAGLGVLTLVLSVVAIAYTGSAVERRSEVALLEQENKDLQRVNLELEKSIVGVQERLDEFEVRTARLALASGMEPDTSGEVQETQTDGVSVGGPYDRLPEGLDVLRSRSDWIADQLGDVEQAMENQNRRFASTPSVAPVVGLISDGYGRRKDPITGRPAFHRGVDLSGRRGTAIIAPADGVVVFAARSGGMGRMVRISHGFGFTTVYAHLNKILVEPGEDVRRGQQIGELGSSGRSTGPHLHYEVYVDGKSVNPLYYILDAY